MENHEQKKFKSEKKWKTKIQWAKQTCFLAPSPLPLDSFNHMHACRSSSKNTWKMNQTSPQAHKVGIWRAWYSRKACEICTSLVQLKDLKKLYFSSHKLPKVQWTDFWLHGVLGIKIMQRLTVLGFPFDVASLQKWFPHWPWSSVVIYSWVYVSVNP
jgi:hypothetical protein